MQYEHLSPFYLLIRPKSPPSGAPGANECQGVPLVPLGVTSRVWLMLLLTASLGAGGVGSGWEHLDTPGFKSQSCY